ncbi:MAG: hypothetical protein M0030_24040 [Actinomycetota bacterium]|nr:hypothetical protein [Actinomycetota bacterium]
MRSRYFRRQIGRSQNGPDPEPSSGPCRPRNGATEKSPPPAWPSRPGRAGTFG